MTQSTLAFVIAGATVVLYMSGIIPLAVTSVLAMLAMYASGILSFTQATAGFGSSAVLLVIGMSIVGLAFEQVGLAHKLGRFVLRRVGTDERRFVCLTVLCTACAASVISSIVVMTIMLQVADEASVISGGKIRRKNAYMPLAFGAIYGSMLSSVSAASIVTGSGILAQSAFGREFMLFEPAILGLPILIVMLLFYYFFGYKLQQRFFDFEEVPPGELIMTSNEAMPVVPAWKQRLTVGVILGCVICFSIGVLNTGAVAMIGACVLIITGCIDEKTALRNLNWQVVFIVAGSLGFAKGLSASGASEQMTRFVIEHCGVLASSEYAMCIVYMLIAIIITNFSSNTSCVTIVLPLAVSTAQSLSTEILPFALAVCVGANLSTAMPIACANMSLTTAAGYRIKDYLRFGGIITTLAAVAAAVMLKILFF